MITDEHKDQFARLEDKIDQAFARNKAESLANDEEVISALGKRNTVVDDNTKRVEVKVARVEEKLDALRERFTDTTDSLVKLIEEHAKNDSDAIKVQMEQNRLFEEKINSIDDFKKKVQYGMAGIVGLIAIVWGAFKLALMTMTGAR